MFTKDKSKKIKINTKDKNIKKYKRKIKIKDKTKALIKQKIFWFSKDKILIVYTYIVTKIKY